MGRWWSANSASLRFFERLRSDNGSHKVSHSLTRHSNLASRTNWNFPAHWDYCSEQSGPCSDIHPRRSTTGQIRKRDSSIPSDPRVTFAVSLRVSMPSFLPPPHTDFRWNMPRRLDVRIAEDNVPWPPGVRPPSSIHISIHQSVNTEPAFRYRRSNSRVLADIVIS